MTKTIKTILGYCKSCNKYFKYPKKERMNTKYANKEDNYVYCCKSCILEINQQWSDQWNEYYGGVL